MSQSSSPKVHKIWYAFRQLPVALALAALLVSSGVCGVAFAQEEEGSIVVDANSTPCMASNHHFTTIGAAVTFAAAHSGATISVCPGKYGEQVVLNTPLTLRGVTVPSANGGKGAGAAVITVPSTGLSVNATVFGNSTPNLAAQVLVLASNVTLSDLAIDGAGSLPPSSSCAFSHYVAGVDFDSGSSGQARHLAVRNQNQSNGSGEFCYRGLGILANQGAGNTTVRDSSISNFDYAGVDGEVPIRVENNAITQVTPHGTGDHFAYGIYLDSTASPPSTVTSNRIVTGDDIYCNVACPGITITDNDIVITHGGCGIYVTGVGATIDANEFSGASYFEYAIMAFGTNDIVTDNVMSSLGPNQTTVEGIGIQLNANANDTVTGNIINEAGYGIEGVTGNTVQENTFHNVDVLTTP